MDWREAARAEAASLKPYYVAKHGWDPRLVAGGDGAVLDLHVRLKGRRFEGRRFLLRLRYYEDWREAGRREDFLDTDDPAVSGTRFWPPEGNGINPNYVHNGVPTPAICLRGVFGYHSVLHREHPMQAEPGTLLRFLVELQEVLDG